jgi:4-hydroxy-tetrahydrodipicolinate synthase
LGELKGLVAAALTPLTQAGAVDVPRLAAHVERLHRQGCDFVSTFGSTGEGASLSSAQKAEALTGLSKAGVDMNRQIPAIMTPVLDEAVKMLIAICDTSCRATLILPPFYYPCRETGFAAFLEGLFAPFGGRPPVDFLLYNIPQWSRFAFSVELVAALRDTYGARLAGLKDSTGDLANGLKLVRAFPQLSIFTGDDRVLAPLLKAGGAGMIGGLPNLFARELSAIYRAPESAEAKDLIARQSERIVAADGHRGIAALKAGLALHLDDAAWNRLLPPLEPLDADEQKSFVAALGQTGFELGMVRDPAGRRA